MLVLLRIKIYVSLKKWAGSGYHLSHLFLFIFTLLLKSFLSSLTLLWAVCRCANFINYFQLFREVIGLCPRVFYPFLLSLLFTFLGLRVGWCTLLSWHTHQTLFIRQETILKENFMTVLGLLLLLSLLCSTLRIIRLWRTSCTKFRLSASLPWTCNFTFFHGTLLTYRISSANHIAFSMGLFKRRFLPCLDSRRLNRLFATERATHFFWAFNRVLFG